MSIIKSSPVAKIGEHVLSDNRLSEDTLWSASTPLANQDQHDLFMLDFISIPSSYLFDQCEAYISQQSIEVQFASPYQILSSSVLNGGYQTSQRYVNLKVSSTCIESNTTPKTAFQEYLQHCPLLEAVAFTEARKPSVNNVDHVVGMMTAATMDSCRIVADSIVDGENELRFFVMATSGIGNLRSVGDEADYCSLYSAIYEGDVTSAMPSTIGTINIFIACNSRLSVAAQAEALMLATEAKVFALSSLQLTSPVSGQLATGTGTDAVAVACPTVYQDPQQIDFVGKHTILGERLGRAVTTAVMASVQRDSTMTPLEHHSSNYKTSKHKKANAK